MDTDTVSGPRLFYQVRPSGGTDPKSVMKLVPFKIVAGKSIHSPAQSAATLISPPSVSSVNVTHDKSSRAGTSAVGLPVCLTPVTAPRQNPITTNTHIEMSYSVQKNRFISTSSLKPPQYKTTTNSPSLSSASPAPKPLSSVAQVALIRQLLPRALDFNISANAEVLSPYQAPSSPHSTVFYSSPMTNINQSVNPELLLRKHLSISSPVAVKVQAPFKALQCSQKPSSANFFAEPAQSTIVYVTPTLSNSSVTPASDYTPNTLKTFFSVSSKSITKTPSNKPLTLIPVFSQRPNSPIKWVVEEEDNSLPSLISASIASEVLEVVAKREQSNKHQNTIPVQHLVGQTNEINSDQKPKDTVVMCNDKVFFAVKNNKTSSDEIMEATSLEEGQSEVIDLCGDVQETVLTEMAAMSGPDEDNVEFVSYIPPQTNSSSGKDTTEKVPQKQKGQVDKAGVDKRHAQKSAGQKVGHTHSTTKLGLAAESMVDDVGADVQTEQSSSREEKRSSHNMEIFGASHDVTSAAPSPVADHILKQKFGIRSEVKISLHRIDTRSADACKSLVIKLPDLDYMEPIDEDFPCALDAHILNAQHSQNCSEVKPSSSRVGRTRKRTKCPCCSPAALNRHQAQKRRPKPPDRDKRETVRKQLKLSSLMSCENNSTPVTVASDCLLKLAMDSEELQIHEQIQILREALRLKEAALEKLKNDKNDKNV